jgi:ParB family chromosome partitioning protein
LLILSTYPLYFSTFSGSVGSLRVTCHSFTIVAAVPVRLMKRDLLFIAEQMLSLLDDKRLEMVARSRGIKPKDEESCQAANRIRAQGRRERTRKADRRNRHPAFRQNAIGRWKGSPRRRPGLQSGHRRHRPQGKSGVRREGEGQAQKRIEPKPAAKALKKTA